MGSVCPGNMCIVLYMKLMWCTGFQEIYAQLEEGGRSAGRSAKCELIYMSCFASQKVFLYYIQKT